MPGEGHFYAMLSRMKKNRNLLKSKQQQFKKNKNLYSYEASDTLVFKTVSDEELKFIKKKNLATIKKQELYKFLWFILFLVMVLLSTLLVFKYFI